ncbi:hypothetical protein KDL44_01760 [bacterium]|nr:hypothetical protein [bacterium]
MIRINRVVILMISFLLLGVTLAMASPGRKMQVEQSLSRLEGDLQSAETVLTAKDSSEWTDEEVETYLFNAMFVIYDGIIIFLDTYDTLPGSSEALRNSGIVNDWPANPFNNWEPIKWENTEFVAGDCVVQVCPPDMYSGLWNPRPMTFAISINGPSADYQPLATPESLYPWAPLPAGAVFQTAAMTEPASKTLKKHEEHEAALAAQQEEENQRNDESK